MCLIYVVDWRNEHPQSPWLLWQQVFQSWRCDSDLSDLSDFSDLRTEQSQFLLALDAQLRKYPANNDSIWQHLTASDSIWVIPVILADRCDNVEAPILLANFGIPSGPSCTTCLKSCSLSLARAWPWWSEAGTTTGFQESTMDRESTEMGLKMTTMGVFFRIHRATQSHVVPGGTLALMLFHIWTTYAATAWASHGLGNSLFRA